MTSLKKPATLDFKTQFGLALDEADDAIVVDLFAGGGGASTGLEMGLGRQVAIAINHNPAAISMHTANHPHTTHYQNDVWKVDPLESVGGRTVGWLHASPDCTHHSQAAGGQPRKKEIRDLSWVVIKWAGKLRKRGKGPWLLSLENVKQIRQWGPLIAKRCKVTGRVVTLDMVPIPGTDKFVNRVAAPGERVPRQNQFLVPDPKRKGSTWRHFLEALRGLGYQVDYWVEKNCDYGDPTTRERLYLVASADGFAPEKPDQTHACAPTKGLKPYRTAAECIDWSDLGKSIRGRKKPLAEATMLRIARGIQREVIERARPFIVPVTPQGGVRLHSVDDPFRTITGANRGELMLASASLVHFRGNCDARPADDPLRVISAGGLHHALVTTELVEGSLSPEQLDGAMWVAAFLIKYHGVGENVRAVDKPASCITTKDRLALVTVWISGDPYVIVDIRLRMLKPRELYRAQGFPDSYIIDRGHDGRRFTLSEQVHMCGNSVSPGTMAAIARANDPWKTRQQERIAA